MPEPATPPVEAAKPAPPPAPPAEKPVETPTEKPVEKPVEKPTETPAPAASAAAAKPPAEAAAAPGTTPAPGAAIVPTQYQLTAPEGSGFDDELLAAFGEEARALKLSNTDAQDLTTFRALVAKQLKDMGDAETRADPEIGGKHYDETVALVKAGRDWLAPPGSRAAQKLVRLFDASGIGNDVDFNRMFRRLGMAVREDRGPGATSAPGSGRTKTAAEILYDKTPA